MKIFLPGYTIALKKIHTDITKPRDMEMYTYS